VSGSYEFGQIEAPVDTVMILYSAAFNPASPGANAVAGNDDNGGVPGAITLVGCGGSIFLCPALSANLNAGQSYSMFISHFSPQAGGDPNFTLPQSFWCFGPGSCSFSVGGVEEPEEETSTVARTSRIIRNFSSRRADQITASEPDLETRLTSKGAGQGAPGAFNVVGTESNHRITFSTSLSQMLAPRAVLRPRADPAVEKQTGFFPAAQKYGTAAQAEMPPMAANAPGGYKDEPPHGPSGFDMWVKGQWARIEQDTSDSDLGLLHVGFDYRFNRDALVGFLLQADWTDETDNAAQYDIDGRGWMAGPYMVKRLQEHLIFDGRVAWGMSDNTISPASSYSDDFNGYRWLAKAQFTGDFRHGPFAIAPHAALIYYKERLEAYTDSLSQFIPGQTVTLGRTTFGPRISTAYLRDDGILVSPSLAIKGIWDFNKADTSDPDSGLAYSADALRARAEGGIAFQMPSGMEITGQGFYDGIGADDLDHYGFSAQIRIPLQGELPALLKDTIGSVSK
jgi:hypothetical protein